MSRLVTDVVVMAPRFNSDGIVAWGVKNIIPILLLVVGIVGAVLVVGIPLAAVLGVPVA